MSVETLVIITVVEIVVLVAGLAFFLLLITARLRSVARILGDLDGGVQLVGQHVSAIGPGADTLNATLNQIGAAVPWLADRAESLTRGTR
jgi:hypothetical protein